MVSLFRRSNEPAAVREARARAEARAAASGSGRDVSQLRSPPRPQDLTLSKVARAWADGLPPPMRPEAVCSQYPRIANRIALCWGDPALTAQLFDQLLVDRRGSRRGFPPAVRSELLALRDHAARRRPDARIEGLEVEEIDAQPWSQRTLVIGDR
jgi:hypothetical protein